MGAALEEFLQVLQELRNDLQADPSGTSPRDTSRLEAQLKRMSLASLFGLLRAHRFKEAAWRA